MILIPFDLGQQVWVIETKEIVIGRRTVIVGYDHMGPISDSYTEYETRRRVVKVQFDFNILAKYGLNNIFALQADANKRLSLILNRDKTPDELLDEFGSPLQQS